nr:uncharacterized protein LOC120964589 [Aegilops tauschii subsp. strangulata]
MAPPASRSSPSRASSRAASLPASPRRHQPLLRLPSAPSVPAVVDLISASPVASAVLLDVLLVLAWDLDEDDGWGKRRKIDYTFDDPYDRAYGDDEEYEYVSGEDVDVDRGNFASFKEKEEEKIRVKGVDYYYKSRTKTWRCPYCTTKPKPKSGHFVHLLAHAEDVAIHGEDYKIMGQHAALAKVMSPLP